MNPLHARPFEGKSNTAKKRNINDVPVGYQQKRSRLYGYNLETSHSSPMDSPFSELQNFEETLDYSQGLLENMSMSQATQLANNNNIMTDVFEMHFILHEDVIRTLSLVEKQHLIELGLYSFTIGMDTKQFLFKREKFAEVFKNGLSGIELANLSRVHGIVSYDSMQEKVFITDKSVNGVFLNKVKIGVGNRKQVKMNDEIALLVDARNAMVLGYRVFDPMEDNEPIIEDTLSNEKMVSDYTLGVLYANPLAGKTKDRFFPMPLLDIGSEYAELVDTMQKAKEVYRKDTLSNGETGIKYSPDIKIDLNFATFSALSNMVSSGCQALHFSGNGNEKCLFLEDGAAGVNPVLYDSLKKLLLADGPSTIKLVFIVSCSSTAIANAFVEAGVPHVVTVNLLESADDLDATKFTKSFYYCIVSGRDVESSFNIAREAVMNSPTTKTPHGTADKFQMFPKNGAHSEVIFPEASTSEVSPIATKRVLFYPALCSDNVPQVCEEFSFRNLDVYQICKYLMRRNSAESVRVITINGETGIGKTSIALAAARYIAERKRFPGGVCVLNVASKIFNNANGIIKLMQYKHDNSNDGIFADINIWILQYLRKLCQSSNSIESLLVLDGVDHFLESRTRADTFRNAISAYLTKYPGLKIMTTSRNRLAHESSPVSSFCVRAYKILKFTDEVSAKLLIRLQTRPIHFSELQSVPNFDQLDIVTCISKHHALKATCGNPFKIYRLSIRLKDAKMDDIANECDPQQRLQLNRKLVNTFESIE